MSQHGEEVIMFRRLVEALSTLRVDAVEAVVLVAFVGVTARVVLAMTGVVEVAVL
jgi:hypothetical protein